MGGRRPSPLLLPPTRAAGDVSGPRGHTGAGGVRPKGAAAPTSSRQTFGATGTRSHRVRRDGGTALAGAVHARGVLRGREALERVQGGVDRAGEVGRAAAELGRVEGDEQGVLTVLAAGRVCGVEGREDGRADQDAGKEFEGEGQAGALGTAQRQRHDRPFRVGGRGAVPGRGGVLREPGAVRPGLADLAEGDGGRRHVEQERGRSAAGTAIARGLVATAAPLAPV
ncbi:hypothetical protein GCM10010259_20200 [Streptomyces daghestanicus]|nr:hypothetical protein GCM10010259_20200 [Streptomyces daghestanicus]